MKPPSRGHLVFSRVTAAAAVVALLVAVFALLGRHDPAVRTAGPASAPKPATREPADPFAAPSLPATAGLMTAADRTADLASLSNVSRPSAAEARPNSFTLDNHASADAPWDGLQTNVAGGSTDAGFPNRQLSATPAPAAAISIEPVAGGDRTDGPVSDPNP